ncbi:glycosyltransferase [Allorhizocola rhizosphaerae]|uniref:glycosyltransferase n=1 Tax=Allorhizocola rhizosphaerae TaxID=1872709 RepID=UPI001FECC080|nr:glycosyltransferase [Allorhizocola rhizosphaerae]
MRSAAGPSKAVSIGMVSTYPPTQCGLATFTASLRAGLAADDPSLFVGVVRVGQAAPSFHDQDVAHVVASESEAGIQDAARALNKFDVAVIQHEYGIYGGADGEQVLDLLELIRVPVVVVAHTVLAAPSRRQRYILETLTQSADAVVTMSATGRRRLLDDYRVEPRKLRLIPHGAPAGTSLDRVRRVVNRAHPMVLTWGLLGPGKGIEWGIDALSVMDPDGPRPRYVVAGQTHPKVVAQQGERYREFLSERAERKGVAHLVEFEPGYLSAERLRELLREADVVLLPYNSDEQVTSGVLTEAMAAGVPVVSTDFPHAVELLGDSRGGLLVPHKNPAAIAAALTRITAEPGLAQAMSTHNTSLASLMDWPTVAGQYGRLFEALLRQSSVSSR